MQALRLKHQSLVKGSDIYQGNLLSLSVRKV